MLCCDLRARRRRAPARLLGSAGHPGVEDRLLDLMEPAPVGSRNGAFAGVHVGVEAEADGDRLQALVRGPHVRVRLDRGLGVTALERRGELGSLRRRAPPTACSGRRGTSRPRSRRPVRPAARGSSRASAAGGGGAGVRRRVARRRLARGVVGALDFDLSPHAARPSKEQHAKENRRDTHPRKVAECVRRR